MRRLPPPPVDAEPGRRLRPWEARAIDAVGSVIEFWGFKRNQGRVWALLFSRGEALSAAEIQRDLSLSKGAVSIITRELERWRVIRRERRPGDEIWRFAAEQSLMEMIGRVLAEREMRLVRGVEEALKRAEVEARADPHATPEELARLGRMRLLAALVARSLTLFQKTARLDATRAARALGNLTGLTKGARR